MIAMLVAAWAGRPVEGPAPPPKDPDQLIWSGAIIPLAGANSQDGAGFGLGGEIFNRPRRDKNGYLLKFQVLGWLTTDLRYTNDYLEVEYRGDTHWIGRFGYRGWSNHGYVGSGGEDVLLVTPDDARGNKVQGPYGFLGASRHLPGSSRWSAFAQAYYKTYWVTPLPGGILDRRRPYGGLGGTYVDATFGFQYNSTDRWPMPTNGILAEWSVRAGITAEHGGEVTPLMGYYGQVIAWKSLGRHLNIGARVSADQTIGPRPFFEQDVAGGRWRDEIGGEQVLSGYGRTRTRGDGVYTAMAEIRPFFFRTNHKVLDFAFHASFYAEAGYLANHSGPGPFMPTIGMGPEVLIQGAIQARMYAALGWRAESRGGRRFPSSQFGVSFTNPL